MNKHLLPRIIDARIFCAVVFAIFVATASSASADDTLDLSEYRGKVVVVDFWASWCVPCRRSFPWLNRMQQKYGDDGLVIVGINVDQDQKDAQLFLEEYPASFRIFSDPSGALAREFDVIAMPSSYVIGRDGKVADTHLGFKVKKQDDYESVIIKTLQAM